ncbi:MAG: hypothetical protein ACE5H9_14515, partial [Anaerolineae bacterium]
MRTAVLIITTALILYLLAGFVMSPLTFLASDNGLRWLQIQELVNHGWRTFAIDYPARFVDPELRHVPYYYAYSVIDNQIFFAISPFFPLIVSALYAGLGLAGLPVLPVLGSVLTAWAVYRLFELSQLRYPYLAFWATIFATPLFFYSLELWDHSLGTALALWGVYGLARGLRQGTWLPLSLGGVAIGLAVGQRPELYVFAIALGTGLILVSWPRWRLWLALGGGGLLGALPVWGLQYLWVGHPLGMSTAPHLLDYGQPDAFPVSPPEVSGVLKAGYLLLHIEPRSPTTFLAALLILLGCALIVLTMSRERGANPARLAGGFVIVILGYGFLAWTVREKPIIGLVSTFPLLPLSLIYPDLPGDENRPQRDVYRLVLLTVFLFLGLMLLAWPTFGGLQWGARYLLPAYPLLLYLAGQGFTVYGRKLDAPRQAILRWGAAGLLLTSALLQMQGARLLHENHRQQAVYRDALAALPADVILTNEPFMPSAMSSITGKIFIHVRDERELEALLPRLAQHGIDRVAVVSQEAAPLSLSDEIGGFSVEQIAPFIYEIGGT